MAKSFLGTLLGTQLHVIRYAQLDTSQFMEQSVVFMFPLFFSSLFFFATLLQGFFVWFVLGFVLFKKETAWQNLSLVPVV